MQNQCNETNFLHLKLIMIALICNRKHIERKDEIK